MGVLDVGDNPVPLTTRFEIFSVLFHILSSEGRVCGCNVLDILEGGGMQDTQ